MSAYANDKGLTVKTEEFTAFCRELKQRLGTMDVTFQKVIDHEIARVLEKAIQTTDVADRQKIRERVKNRSTFLVGGKKWRTRNYNTGQSWHVPDSIWAEIEAKRGRSLSRKLLKVGLTKNSFYLLAEKLGQSVNAPGYVKMARAQLDKSGGLNNVSVARKMGGHSYGVRIDNAMPILRWTNGTQAWFAALAGRIGFYRKNVARGVFDTTANIAKKYKGLLVG